MNPTRRSTNLVALALAGTLLGTLAGCVVYTSDAGYGPAYEGAPPPDNSVVVVQNDSDFYEPLSAYGQWEVVGSFGNCWVPGGVAPGWRPYCDGSWVSTDAGWYWNSPEPWGWATYHYGRWDYDLQVGWFWVPDTHWAPSWVSWREGHDCIGWAPLGPGARPDRDDFDRRRDEDRERAYVFVEQRRFLDPVRPTTVVRTSATLINQTTNITNIQVVNRTVINEGPSPAFVERVSGRQVRPQDVRTVRQEHERPEFRGAPRGQPANVRYTPQPGPPHARPEQRGAPPARPQYTPPPQPQNRPAPEARPTYHPIPANPTPAPRPVEATPYRETPRPAAPAPVERRRPPEASPPAPEAPRAAERAAPMRPPVAQPAAPRPAPAPAHAPPPKEHKEAARENQDRAPGDSQRPKNEAQP